MFHQIKTPVQQQFSKMLSNQLFVVQLEKNELFNLYLASLPEHERQDHNCNCCRAFLNNYGGIVTIADGNIHTLWDFDLSGTVYDKVPSALRTLIQSKSIDGVFLTKFDKLGTDSNLHKLDSGEVIRHIHFFLQFPKSKLTRSTDSLDTIRGNIRTTKEVFERSLTTITTDAVDSVLDLISQNALYRGKEFEQALLNFSKHQTQYNRLDQAKKQLYVWNHATEGGRIRNTAIGTLLVNLSEGMPLDNAVRAFESIVAPANYKRPTALVTEKMVKDAQKKIEELGLTASLRRRHATADDISVSNLLFVNRTNKVDSLFDSVASDIAINPKSVKGKEIKLDDFISKILPSATSVELLLENNHSFMSLIAPEDRDAENMFAWDNPISWTYQNNMTDVVKEKVKTAGGKVDGELRISLEWFNYDDLDLHVVEPGGHEISFRDRKSAYGDGFLDVDMNAGGGRSREPVENIAYDRQVPTGKYRVVVHNFCKRENIDLGFNVQIECRSQGTVINLNYDRAAQDREYVEVATFNYDPQKGITNFQSALEQSCSQREVNGLMTNRFHKVRMMMFSPNHWSDATGNKHLFMIVDGANIDVPLRPFFNEYLKASLNDHRKVFEILGSKLMVKPTDDQLSGIGFSLTQQTEFVVKVNNVPHRVIV